MFFSSILSFCHMYGVFEKSQNAAYIHEKWKNENCSNFHIRLFFCCWFTDFDWFFLIEHFCELCHPIVTLLHAIARYCHQMSPYCHQMSPYCHQMSPYCHLIVDLCFQKYQQCKNHSKFSYLFLKMYEHIKSFIFKLYGLASLLHEMMKI